MQKMDWDLYLMPYEQAVEELKVKLKNIRNEFKRRKVHSPIEFVTGRVKSINSIYNKATRLHFPINENIAWEIRDIAGLRIICQFIDDISFVVDMLRERKDMKIFLEKDYVTQPKETGYRGYHLAVEYPIMTIDGQKTIPVEIQIRTLGMNFWATIEHSLQYKYEGIIPEDIKLRLVESAKASYTLDNEMNKIRDEVKEAQIEFTRKKESPIDPLLSIVELDLDVDTESVYFDEKQIALPEDKEEENEHN
ncbi:MULTISPECIES: GTP pyrophosphokinase [Brevibacillus]|uniref:GTP pyrophosphokinase n=1 Tax=Brevibacillus TaxID=55080 RepID=UPI000E2F0319|nr:MULTISPECIES: GTP pyrophosphokinase family protein [Brevibacillus]MCG7319728.1 GTP pyrophosphokinase family protein [Brevibacillus laterosporus]MED1787019.1 GTP pyrophosphokinase family protein [Brevibacillus laterosporus]RFB32210.1 GTP pyrophosphokinase family protein [Brevibacillus sp. VP]